MDAPAACIKAPKHSASKNIAANVSSKLNPRERLCRIVFSSFVPKHRARLISFA